MFVRHTVQQHNVEIVDAQLLAKAIEVSFHLVGGFDQGFGGDLKRLTLSALLPSLLVRSNGRIVQESISRYIINYQ